MNYVWWLIIVIFIIVIYIDQVNNID